MTSATLVAAHCGGEYVCLNAYLCSRALPFAPFAPVSLCDRHARVLCAVVRESTRPTPGRHCATRAVLSCHAPLLSSLTMLQCASRSAPKRFSTHRRCGHCKSLTPIYEKVGAHFKSNDAVVIAKLDATANDVPDARFSVKGFPTLYLLTATGEVVPYNGGRTEAEIVSFVEKYAAEAGAEEEAVAAPEEHDEL